MSLRICGAASFAGALLAVLALIPGSGRAATAAPPGEAVVLLDEAPAETDRLAGLAGVITAQVGGAWRVVPGTVPEIPRPDPACSTPEASRRLQDILAGVREGHRLFFDETDLERAEAVLAAAVDRVLDHPCVLAGPDGARARAEILSGAVNRVRVLMYGRPADAAALARRIAFVFPDSAVEALDVPPEVGRFLAGVRRDVESVTAALTVEVAPMDAAGGIEVAVDGQPLAGPWVRTVPAGPHEVAVLRPDGTAATLRLVTAAAPVTARFDLVLAGALQAGPRGTLIRTGGGDPAAIARRVAEVTGRTVLRVQGAGTDDVRVSAVSPSKVLPDLLTIRPSGRAFDVIVAPASPTLSRPSWPWPWVALGLSAGLLGAGIGSNVAASRESAAIRDGRNRVDAYQAWRDGAISCYALAGAGAVTTLLLYFLRPGPATRFHVVPAEGGAAAAATF